MQMQDEATFKFVPKSEQLPLTVSSPALRHLSGLPSARGIELRLMEGVFVVLKYPSDSAKGMANATSLLGKGRKSPVFVSPTADEISVICSSQFCSGWEGKDDVSWDAGWR